MLPPCFHSLRLRGCLAVASGAFLALTLGNFYTVGNLSPYLASYMRQRVDGTVNSSKLVWMTGLFMLGLGTLGWLGGVMVEKIGTRLTALIGSLFYCGFFALSMLSVSSSFAAFACTFGYFSWTGASILWVAAVTAGIKWFPNQTGLATSVINCGYGIGGVVFNTLGTWILNPDNEKPNLEINEEWYFQNDEILDRIPNYFGYITIIMVGLNILALPFMFHAPDEVSKQNQGISKAKLEQSVEVPNGGMGTTCSLDKSELLEISPREMFKHKEFYLIWITFAFLMLPVNFVVTYYKTYGLNFIKDDQYLTIVGGVGVFCTCVGKLFWGVIVEKKSYKLVMLAYTLLFAFLMQALVVAQAFDDTASRKIYFIIFVMLNYAWVGGNFTLLPTVVAVAFGNKHAGTNYGIYYSAQSVGSFAGAYVCQVLVDELHWVGSFTCISAFAILAAITTLFMPLNLSDIRRPKPIVGSPTNGPAPTNPANSPNI